jgi:hypothetical protein
MQYPARTCRRKTIQVFTPEFILIITSGYVKYGFQDDIMPTILERNTLLFEISAD